MIKEFLLKYLGIVIITILIFIGTMAYVDVAVYYHLRHTGINKGYCMLSGLGIMLATTLIVTRFINWLNVNGSESDSEEED